tara:strand:+ start:20 stop:1384 length:1365 start_codon:yes stop_codon:yes gene_type:complete
MANTYLTRSNGTSTEQKIFTFSAWVKRSAISTSGDKVLMAEYTDSNNRMKLQFKDDDFFEVYQVDGGSVRTQVKTNRKFRDSNGWYHMLIVGDNTQGTNTNRLKIYVNGVQETSFSVSTYPYSSTIPSINENSKTITIGNDDNGGSYFDGSMSHVHFVDGSALAPTVFGSTDSTTGEWRINTSPSYTAGTNGFFILKDGNSVTDQSANSNNFTVGGGTLTKTEDCPSNNFCTLNPLTQHTYTFSNGNNTIVRGSSASSTMGTIAPSSGKWYWEVKLVSGQSNYPRIGVYKASNADNHIHTTYLGNASGGTGKWWGSGGSGSGNNIIADGNASTTAFYSYTNGDILMFAMDNDNGKLWFGKNGTWYTNDNSTTTTGTAIGNGTATPAFSTLTVGENWAPSVFGNDSADVWSANFGNGYFGTTAVSSAGTNTSGLGIFEYNVPAGFTALCTKGLNL